MLSFLRRTPPPSPRANRFLDVDIPTGLYVPGDMGSRFPKIHHHFRRHESPSATRLHPGGRVEDTSLPSNDGHDEPSLPTLHDLNSPDQPVLLHDSPRPVPITRRGSASQPDISHQQRPGVVNPQSRREAPYVSPSAAVYDTLGRSFPMQSSHRELTGIRGPNKVQEPKRGSASETICRELCPEVTRGEDCVAAKSFTEALPGDSAHTVESINHTLIKGGRLGAPATALLGTFQPRKRSNTSPPTVHASITKTKSSQFARQKRVWRIPLYDDMDQLSRQIRERLSLDRSNTAMEGSMRRARPLNPNGSIGRRNRIVPPQDYGLLQVCSV